MKLQQPLSFLMALLTSATLYAVGISSLDDLDEEPDYETGAFHTRTLRIDFATKGRVTLQNLPQEVNEQILDFKETKFSKLYINFQNVATAPQLNQISNILNTLVNDYEQIEVLELDFKAGVKPGIEAKGKELHADFKARCEQAESDDDVRDLRYHAHKQRTQQSRDDFEESNGPSGYMSDDYFSSDDDF